MTDPDWRRRALMMVLGPAVLALAGTLVAQAQEPGAPVLAAEARPASVGIERNFTGRVAARRTVDLAFEVAGRLVRLEGREGQALPGGTVVAALDPVPFQLALDEARVQAGLAERGLSRLRSLYVRGAGTEAALEEAEAAYDLRRIAEQAAERDLSLATLTAPFDAMIARRLVEEGSLIQPGTAVIRLHDVGEWRVKVSVPESLMRLGTSPGVARIEAVIDRDSGTRAQLEYREHEAEPDPVARTFVVTFAIDLPSDSTLLPGMTLPVLIALEGDAAPGEVTVPGSALVARPDGSFEVWRIQDGTARAVAVSLAGIAGDRALIASGLVPGDLVVTAGQSELTDGQAVRPLTDG